ncbi:hypothetical protein CVT26_012200 [Gymnopilus dilepis]|uniref:Uncharacterized protein n=1 Tax=Gymnopilus dilepis TaxID=231916 RepID=A0A409YC83_9AGAR|nr:hypothetical protein CVT26_012200 [Gymnopilus dilepis]
MADDSNSSEENSLYDFLEKWQNTCLFENQLTFTEAIESLSPKAGKRLIEARVGTGTKSSTWTLFDTRTNREAILVHAAVWRFNTDTNTGNFVPPEETPPIQIPTKRLQRTASFKCEIAYTIDTGVEDSFYNNLQILEEYVQTIKGFNRENNERSPWQNGSHRDSYTLTSKLFVKKGLSNIKEPSFTPHEWLTRGVKAQKTHEYVINPRRPLYFDLVNEKAVQLENSKPARYRAGDIIWFAFKVTFYIGSQYWSSEITPLEFMRVAHGSKYGLSGDDEDEDDQGNQRKSLADGDSISVIPRNPYENIAKRKNETQSDDEKTASSDSTDSADAEKRSSTEDANNVNINGDNVVAEGTEDQAPPKKKTKKVKT